MTEDLLNAFVNSKEVLSEEDPFTVPYLQKTKKMKNGMALIVDDEEDTCKLLVMYLRNSFEKVEYALNIKDGIRLALSLKPDLLILDNNLPDGTGIQKISEFRLYCKRILVISAMIGLEPQAMVAGADYFLPKPIGSSDIRNIIEN